MGLLDDQYSTVTLIPEIVAEDSQGNPGMRVPDPDLENRQTITGRVQSSSSVEPTADGQRVVTFHRLLCREFPAGAWARVIWEGREFDVDGEPIRHDDSDMTAHDTVALRARVPEAVA
jgi:hypothetical protein